MKKILLSKLLVLSVFLLQAQTPILDKLKPDHPRLLVDAERIEELKNLAKSDTLLAELIQMVHNYADSALEAPVIIYEFDGPGNPRLKAQRRAAMFRV